MSAGRREPQPVSTPSRSCFERRPDLHPVLVHPPGPPAPSLPGEPRTYNAGPLLSIPRAGATAPGGTSGRLPQRHPLGKGQCTAATPGMSNGTQLAVLGTHGLGGYNPSRS